VRGGIGGREALERIREIDGEVPAIVMSGYSEDPILARPGDFGFAGVLAKPFRIEDLASVLARLLAARGR
jgi:CheY-like chemotaxis protein